MQIQALIQAEEKAKALFELIEKEAIIRPGRDEMSINQDIYQLAQERFGIKKFWHKRIVRAGKNTVHPYAVNPPNLTIQENDIVFLDFGPVFDEWEADFGRTYVLGTNPTHHKLHEDVERIWNLGKNFYDNHKPTPAALYTYVAAQARQSGWEFGNEHAGHLIGEFPHERVFPDAIEHYIHPENQTEMHPSDVEKHWILEVHLIDPHLQCGAFFEQLLG